MRNHERLAEAMAAGTITAERAAQVLGAQPRDVAAIAAGRVGLPVDRWRLLRAAIDDAALPPGKTT